jgi:recombination protein RecA
MASDNPPRDQALDLALGQIEKKHGKGSIMRLGDGSTRERVASISTGSIAVDIATGVGGIPRGRIVEIYGPESSGKTTLTLHVIANVQKTGGVAAFIDAEHALDPDYAKLLGVDTTNLLVSQPDDGEQALEIAEILVRSAAVDCIVIDSVAALVPRAEVQGDMGDLHVGLQARLMSQAMRKLTAVTKKTDCSLMFINQIREKIGVLFGSPETTPGGNALKFYASMRLDIRRIGAIKDGDAVVGNRTKVKVVKNKCAPPFRQAEFDIMYNEGISLESDLIDIGVDRGIVQKSGSWLAFGETRIGQGKEAARKFLKENRDVAAKIEHDIRAAAGILPQPVEPAAEGEPGGAAASGDADASRPKAEKTPPVRLASVTKHPASAKPSPRSHGR